MFGVELETSLTLLKAVFNTKLNWISAWILFPFMVYWTSISLDLSLTPVLWWSWNFIVCALGRFYLLPPCLRSKRFLRFESNLTPNQFSIHFYLLCPGFLRSCGFSLLVFFLWFETENPSIFLVFVVSFYTPFSLLSTFSTKIPPFINNIILLLSVFVPS